MKESDVIVLQPQPGPQTMFCESPADIVIFGGQAFGGKTFGILLETTRHLDVPDFGAVIFRRTNPQITNVGGLWDTSMKIYPFIDGKPYESNPKSWEFPAGSKVSFHHLQHDKDVYAWQGSQIPLIIFDEITHFTAKQFWYMVSRNRSTCGVRPYIRATCNPEPGWVADLIAWWWDPETGYAIPERSGVVRWFLRRNEELVWGDSKEELLEQYPDADENDPKSITFIESQITDNPIGMKADPGYLGNLKALPLVERERLLKGNWKIVASAGNVFRKEWLPVAPENIRIPRDVPRVRYWDKAGTQDDGDWTVSVLIAQWNKRYYIEDVTRDQLSIGKRNRKIRDVTAEDSRRYSDVTTWFEQEGGSGGKESAYFSLEELQGYAVYSETVSHQGSKLARARPLSAAAEHGFVYLLPRPWNDGFRDRMAAFPTKGVPDDEIDAAGGAFNKLTINAGAQVYH